MDIRVPQLAEGVETGTVVSVLVKAGDKVKKDQSLLELETNKAVANITASSEGVVSKVHVSEGAQVAVGQILISISEGGASSQEKQPTVHSPQSTEKPKASPSIVDRGPSTGINYQYQSQAGFPPPASPSVRKMAADLGIDLSRVQGTENGGRISLADVRNYLTYLQQLAISGVAPVAAQVAAPAAAIPSEKKAAPSVDFSKWGPITKKPMTQLRKTISDAMVNSWTTIPHVTQFDDIDIGSVMKLRKTFEGDYEKKGARLTLTPFVVKAIVACLKKYPIFNSSIDENTKEVVTKEYYNIGIAVDTEHGLMVPVIKDADKKSLLEVSLELEKLADKTRSRKLAVDEMQGGTFTISNQGGIGGKHFTPIINKPEVAILGVGRGGLVPVATKTGIQTATMMPVGFSYDHRLIDGGSAARFIVAFAQAMNAFTDSEVALAKASPAKTAKKK